MITPPGLHRRSEVVMGTIVTIDVPHHAVADEAATRRDACVAEAFEWFRRIEHVCTRFNPGSELMRLIDSVGQPTHVSPMLFEVLRFSLAVAEASGGAYDPTVGLRMERRGFSREHHTGQTVATPIDDLAGITFRDVALDEEHHTITLRRPLVLDLGGVAKGMAIDLAARAMAPLEHFGIDAGGDVYVSGHNANGTPWSVGIRHPQGENSIGTLQVSNRSVCTSGNYERCAEHDSLARHIFDPRTGMIPSEIVSATVVAPSAMLADALATAAFVSGSEAARQLLESHGVCGVLFTSTLERLVTEGCESDSVFVS
jgi:FAD:protein FMN transferase